MTSTWDLDEVTALQQAGASPRAKFGSRLRGASELSVGLALLGALVVGCGGSDQPEPSKTTDSESADTDDSDEPKDAGPRKDAGSSGPSSKPNEGRMDAGGAKPPAERDSGRASPRDASGPVVSERDGSAGSGSTDGGRSTDGAGPASGSSFPAAGDLSKDGPYGSMTVTGTGPGSMYTVYRPAMLAPEGAKNPIVGWMSGGGTTHTLYPLLPRLATHGFVVVAADVVPGIGAEAELGKQIIAGIEWAIAENAKQGSALFDKLDTTKIASMGYSMGSLATFMIASDPRLTTTVHISGGNMAPERVANLRQPAAFICGTPGGATCSILSPDCDLAAANCDMDFEGATTPVFYANFTGGHLGILTAPLDAQIGLLATQWLRWKLMSDSSLDALFVGDQCTVCKDASWKVQQK
jgi:pimeloyl-ACP methyl ester carboxylesterase